MIEFDVTEEDGDRALRIKDTGVLVGWIAEGRKMIDSTGPWTEWAFEANDHTVRMGPTRRSLSEAYDDARAYAQTRTGDAETAS